jgi:DNA ligase (NAD+)
VVKIANVNYRELLGTTNHHPKRAIAYKYPAKQAITTINQVEFQVGRTGILTPVAHLDPVELSGVTIARVSLHNPDFISEKDIRVNDKVVLQRSGEVIPYIVCSLPEMRDGKQIPIIFPTQCPVCKELIHKEVASSGNTSYYCINASCPASTKEKIKHFVGRDMMDIQ